MAPGLVLLGGPAPQAPEATTFVLCWDVAGEGWTTVWLWAGENLLGPVGGAVLLMPCGARLTGLELPPRFGLLPDSAAAGLEGARALLRLLTGLPAWRIQAVVGLSTACLHVLTPCQNITSVLLSFRLQAAGL